MNVLRRYMTGVILRSVGTVLSVLVLVTSLVQFVSQLDDIGVGNYGFREALVYVLLGVPNTVFQSLPAATLLGALLGLGHLATQSELVAMRAAGVSTLQLCGAAGFAGLVLAATMGLLGQSFAPSLGAYAREMRGQALLDDSALANGQSTWLKDANVIVNLRRGGGDIAFDSGVYVFEFGDDRALTAIGRGESAELDARAEWALVDYAETRFADDGLAVSAQPESVRHYGFNPELFSLSVVRDFLLDMPALQRYIEYLETNGLDSRRYVIAYWGRVADVVSVPFMALLALAFVFGGLRSAGAGARLVAGLIVGLGFYVADEVLSNSGTVFDFDPVVVAWAPTIGLALAAFAALSRVR
jgi:lipopolysaccharide export system permease protein